MSNHIERKRNILVVDDAPDNLMLLEAILDSDEFGRIILASSAIEAYEFIGIHRGEKEAEIDLILMDIMMPDITGIEAIREIRRHEEYQDIPIVVVSAKSETEDLVEAFEAGAVDYLTKPINELELLARIRSMLRLKAETDHRKFHEKELERLAAVLEEKNMKLSKLLEELHDDLEAAGNMQRSMLPDKRLTIDGIKFAWYYEPCENIGGDLLNFVPLGNGKIAMFILDVSGHGIQSAMLAVSVHRMLSAWEGANSILRMPDGSLRAPSEILTELNDEFMLHKNNFQYFTMIYGILDVNSRSFCYCRAGHTPLLIQKASGELSILDAGSVPVGLTENCSFQQFEIHVEPGDRIIMFSDGITEARRNQDKSFFGDDRFFRLVKESRSMDPDPAMHHIIRELKAWMGSTSPADDITLMIVDPSVSAVHPKAAGGY